MTGAPSPAAKPWWQKQQLQTEGGDGEGKAQETYLMVRCLADTPPSLPTVPQGPTWTFVKPCAVFIKNPFSVMPQ